MRSVVPSPLVALALAAAALSVPSGQTRDVAYTGKLSALSIPADALGPQWSGPTGLVIDDFKDLSQQPADVRPMVEGLKKQLAPLGVVGVADFTYENRSAPLAPVTVRVFVFDTEKSRLAWWKTRYRYDGWEKQYTVVSGTPYDAVDSTEMKKRIVSFGNVWITSGSPGDSGDHLRILDLYIGKLRTLAHGKQER